MNNNFNADEKILKHTDKLDYFFNGHKTLIVTELDLTNKCNNLCPGCCGRNENGAELSKVQIDKIIKELAEINNRGIILSGGGEPLISPHFEYAVKLIISMGMKIGINSNGLALTTEKAELIAQYATYFRVSLDAGTPEMYKQTHGMPEKTFIEVLENCIKFAEIKKKTGSKTSFGLGFLTSENTKKDAEQFIKISKEAGADFAQFRPFTEDIYDIRNEYYRLKEKYEDEKFSVTASLQKYREMTEKGKRDYDKCKGMFFSTVVTADAKMYACLHFRQDEKYKIGDLNKQTVSEIFKSAKIREVYEGINCKNCPSLCRNDVFNRTLNKLSLDISHIEFL